MKAIVAAGFRIIEQKSEMPPIIAGGQPCGMLASWGGGRPQKSGHRLQEDGKVKALVLPGASA
jgi:hypothetical protein